MSIELSRHKIDRKALESESYGVSVIIPVHNDGRYLRESVESVYGQDSDLPFEVIVVDDASSDPETLVAFEEIQQDYPDIQVLHQRENKGVSAARNLGLAVAQYRYIFALDVDNKLSTDPALIANGRGYMDRCVAMMESDPDVMMVRCEGQLFEGQNSLWKLPEFSEKRILVQNMIDTHAMYRRDEALAIGGYNENPALAYEDWDFAVAMLNQRKINGQKVRVETVRSPVFMYRVRDDGSSRNQDPNNDRQESYRAIIRRSPHLYKRHFSQAFEQGEDALLNAVMKRARKYKFLRYAYQMIDPRMWGFTLGCVKVRARNAFNLAVNNNVPEGGLSAHLMQKAPQFEGLEQD